MPSVLIHICCAHCGAYTMVHWQQKGYEVTAFWFNPNIHPFQEHQRRLEAVKQLTSVSGVPLIIVEGYHIQRYFREIAYHEEERCRRCFDLRLTETAKTTCEHHFSAFTSTLLISPHQKHAAIKEAGEAAARQYDAVFEYEDLRQRYSDSRRMTKPLDIYRQQYCGCLFSEWEGYSASGPSNR